ncbi:LysR family transcriptional regulator [Sneathiella marina]|uniref:LysR family transcriptional regulator n=1 Tax=Sneathiella marina TaxID=2950108 RepID=A0ABY4W494_9PROT|nr:LysR family transcriptional regulator [Sneathiella marina]USG62008.1 LysR family transcriptional regulator [Sneathiella marina]
MHNIFLHYLDEVARQNSIRKAAKILNVSSTSVNRKIINVEEQLGIRLFDRSPEGVEITAAGKIVLEHCRKTLYDFNQVRTIIDDIRDLKTGHLSIETVDSMTFGVLPRILEEFSKQHPSISLSVTTSVADDISKAVATGDADMGFNFTKEIHPDVRVVAEKAAPFGIIMRPDHPLAERHSVGIADVEGYPLVRTIDARSRNSILDQEMKIISSSLTTHIFTNALTIAKQAIFTNQAIGIYTKIGFLKEIEMGELKFVPLSIKSLSDYKIGLIISSSTGIDPVKRVFINAVERIFKTLNFSA